MAKLILEEKIDAIMSIVENGFAAVADDLARMGGRFDTIERNMATKNQIIALHTQVNAIETDLRVTKQHKLVTRVADLEQEIFGKPRA